MIICDMKWYVIQTYSGKEEEVKNKIKENIKTNKVEDFFKSVFIPKEEVTEIINGAKKKIKRIVFPGYIFLNMLMDSLSWNVIHFTLGVSKFLSYDNIYPGFISDNEINNILRFLTGNINLHSKPRTLFNLGEIVRILEGPFSDFTGVIEYVDYEKSKLYVAVSIFGRSTPLELYFYQIEKNL